MLKLLIEALSVLYKKRNKQLISLWSGRLFFFVVVFLFSSVIISFCLFRIVGPTPSLKVNRKFYQVIPITLIMILNTPRRPCQCIVLLSQLLKQSTRNF